MLQKIPFYHTSDLRYLKGENILFVTPNTQQADSLRTIVQKNDWVANFDVITIANFIRKEWCETEIIQKSDIITVLGVAWKKFFPQRPYAQFSRGLNLLTDLRSYSLDINLISSILDDFDQEQRKIVELFWKLCDELKLYDEHKVYQELSHRWRSGKTPRHTQRHFVFWGFEFFSALQIDLLESLALAHQVDLLAPAMVFEQSGNFDWPRWVSGEISSPLAKKTEVKRPLQLVRFSKNHLNQAIREVLEKNSILKYDIVLAQKNTNFEQILELPVRNHLFKSPVEFLKTSFLKCCFELQKFIDRKTSDVIDYCRMQKEQAIHRQDFKEIKNWHDLENFLNEWQERSDENLIFNKFDWELTKQVITLNHPRLFYLPISDQGHCGKILNLRKRPEDWATPKFIIGQSKYGDLKSNHSQYGLNSLNYLATIGPIKRPEFDFLFVQQVLDELLDNDQAYLFLEEGLETENLAWSELLESYKKDREFQEISFSYRTEKKFKSPAHQTNTRRINQISPKRLQEYIDCPQKYYYQYVEKIKIYSHLKGEILPNERGIIEHKIIGQYLKQSRHFDPKLFSQICREEIDNFCNNNHKHLNTIDYMLTMEEIEVYAQNGINFLITFLQNLKNPHMNFEVAINTQGEYSFGGSVDCIIQSRDGDYLFDFKRSLSSIPSQKSIVNYEKIQICYYAAHLPNTYNWKKIGYINLSEPENSCLLTANLNSLVQGYLEKETDYLKQLAAEKDFSPRPRSSTVCQYCIVKAICPRGKE